MSGGRGGGRIDEERDGAKVGAASYDCDGSIVDAVDDDERAMWLTGRLAD